MKKALTIHPKLKGDVREKLRMKVAEIVLEKLRDHSYRSKKQSSWRRVPWVIEVMDEKPALHLGDYDSADVADIDLQTFEVVNHSYMGCGDTVCNTPSILDEGTKPEKGHCNAYVINSYDRGRTSWSVYLVVNDIDLHRVLKPVQKRLVTDAASITITTVSVPRRY